MTSKTQKQQEITAQLADLTETMQREKITLSPEMKEYLKQSVETVQAKLMKGEPVYPKDMEFINKIKSWVEVEKIKQVFDKSYDEMVDTLRNYRYKSKIPDKQTVMNAIRNLGPEMLEKIKKFNRPTILMIPKLSLRKLAEKFDCYKKCSGQENTFVDDEKAKDTLWNPKAEKFTVSIVDGASEMPQLPLDKIGLKNEQKHRYLTEEYKTQGMKMISAREYMMLAHKSLRAFEKTHNSSEIIDWNTITTLNTDHLKYSDKVPVVKWFETFNKYYYHWLYPDDSNYRVISRPSVQVL